MYRFFNLYSFCIPVKGKKRAVVCDLQRNVIQPIPLVVYGYLEKIKIVDSPNALLNNYNSSDKRTIEEYINFLYHNEFGYFTASKSIFCGLQDQDNPDSSIITNSIVDFDQKSTHSIDEIIPQLVELGCKAIEIRFFSIISHDTLIKNLSLIQNSTIEKIEILLQKKDYFTCESMIELSSEYDKLSKVTISNSSDNVIYKHNDLVVIYTTEIIRNETKCGVTGELYCIADSKLFWESRNYNNCLYKKISIDKNSLIKNCPSMQENFGSISTTKLMDVVSLDSYRKYWAITKDEIEVCSECELRYVCQDCRAYTIHMNNIYSKPLKCRYNPME